MNFVKNSFGAFLYAVWAYLKTEFRAAAAASLGAPSLTVVPSDCAMLLRSRRTKDGGIMREMSLSMREPSVSPRGADAVGSLSRGNGGGGNT